MNETELARWVAERAAKDDRLYEQYGKQLEPEHSGEFVAISDDGEVMLGTKHLELIKRAIEAFGSGRFALRRIGFDWEIRVRRL